VPRENLDPPDYVAMVCIQGSVRTTLDSECAQLVNDLRRALIGHYWREAYRRSCPGRNADWWMRRWLRLP